MEHVWSYLFSEKMHIDPKEQRILLTEAPMNPRENRRRMIEVRRAAAPHGASYGF